MKTTAEAVAKVAGTEVPAAASSLPAVSATSVPSEVSPPAKPADAPMATATNVEKPVAGRAPVSAPATGRVVPRLTGDIALQVAVPTRAASNAVPAEAVPLTTERLRKGWQLLLDSSEKAHPELFNLICDKKVRAKEEEDMVVIEVNNAYFDVQIKPYATIMMEELRKLCANHKLTFVTEVVEDKGKQVTYSAKDKYDAMLKVNPEIGRLKQLFGEIEM